MDSGALTDGAVEVIWEPQPGPQEALLACPAFEIFYGGARGGGKTDGMLGEWADHADQYQQHANGVFFRRSLIQLDETIERSKEIYQPLGAVWREQKKFWTFPGGARLKFRPLERDADAERYQGHSYTRIYVEEITNFPDPTPIMKLKAALRSAAGAPVGFRSTGNPGGPGHQWVKARYVDPAPLGYTKVLDADTGLERVYIPAKVADNPALVNSDPFYVARLKGSGSKELVRAWLDGDWDSVVGAYFNQWRNEKHVVKPVKLPSYWTKFRAFDWGSARPFCCLWIAVSDGQLPQFPRGALVVYREWYGCKEPNVGLKLDVEEVARGIAERQGSEKIRFSKADPSIFKEDGGPSMANRMQKAARVSWTPADNERVPGWGAAARSEPPRGPGHKSRGSRGGCVAVWLHELSARDETAADRGREALGGDPKAPEERLLVEQDQKRWADVDELLRRKLLKAQWTGASSGKGPCNSSKAVS
jgi:hypothetical protein